MSGQGSFGAFRTHGLGVDGWTPLGSGRRKIEAEDIAFALASRPRMGWQTIARIRGVNEVDLRRACAVAEKVEAPVIRPDPPAPAFDPAVAFMGAPPIRQMQVMRAILAGAVTHEQIAARCGIIEDTSRSTLRRLRVKGLVADQAPPSRGWRLTTAGHAQLKAWERVHG